MLEGVRIIAERIKAFPEEVPRWKHFMNTQLTDMLTPEEHECINEALKEHFRQDFNARVLDMLNKNDVKADPRKPRFKTKEEFQPVSSTDPRMAMQRKDLLYGLMHPILKV